MTTKTAPLKMRLIKFGSKTCGACHGMDKAKTLERFAEEHPEVSVLKLDVSDDEGESPGPTAVDPTNYDANMKASDTYGVTVLPTLIFEVEGFGEVNRIEGAANLKMMLAEMKKAIATANNYAERASALPF